MADSISLSDTDDELNMSNEIESGERSMLLSDELIVSEEGNFVDDQDGGGQEQQSISGDKDTTPTTLDSCSLADQPTQDLISSLVSCAIEKCLPLSRLGALIQDDPTADRLMARMPTEADLVRSHLRPIADELLADIRSSLADSKPKMVAFARKSLRSAPEQAAVSMYFVMLGHLPQVPPEDGLELYLVDARPIDGSDPLAFDRLFRGSLAKLWPQDTEQHTRDLLLCITDDPGDMLSDELTAKLCPNLITVNGLEVVLREMKQTAFGALADDHDGGDKSQLLHAIISEVDEALEDIISGEMELVGAVDSLEYIIEQIDELEWAKEPDVARLLQDVLAALPDYDCLVDIAHQLESDEVAGEVNENASAFRFAPLGGLSLSRCFPSLDAMFLGVHEQARPIPLEYVPFYALVYGNASSLLSK